MALQLTLLLPLKGRHLHTLRFLWHANRLRMPYHFLVADGEAHPSVSRLLTNSAETLPHLSIEYVRYPDDSSYSLFYKKMADAAARVKTPYVMQADNDDFPLAGGIEYCVAQLETNSDLAVCGAGVGGFHLRPVSDERLCNVIGPVDRVTFRFMNEYLPQDYMASTAAERVCDAFDKTHTCYYSVFRSQHLATITRELADLDFSDLHLHEIYFGMRAKTFGKMRSDGRAMFYMRQAGTALPHLFRGNWVEHFLRSRYTSDFTKLLEKISSAIREADGRSDPSLPESILRLYAARLSGQLQQEFRVLTTPSKTFALKAWVANHAPLGVRQRRDVKKISAALQRQGATKDATAVFKCEWSDIGRTLQGGEFVAFVRSHAPDLLDVNAGARARLEAAVA